MTGPLIGVAALARPTFDVPYAKEMAAGAFAALDAAGVRTVGPRGLLFDAAAARAALAELAGEPLDGMLLLQVTFTDATMTVEIADRIAAPLAIWAFPEPRAGGRLRLNAFCGLNLALHALGRAGRTARYLYAAPDMPGLDRTLAAPLAEWPALDARSAVPPRADAPAATRSDEAAARALAALRGSTIGLVGEHPAGFDTCRYEPAALDALAGIRVQPVPLPSLFDRARAAPDDAVARTRHDLDRAVGSLDAVDQPQLDRSLRVHAALDELRREYGLAALAVRCWPEMFTDYGCAACGPAALMNGAGVPCACEADVYGAVSQLLLQHLAGEPAWLVDIVDMDAASDTGVFWHCGSAPLSMRDPEAGAEAQIHSNRRMPLLMQFPLKPGRISIGRISQAGNRTALVIGGGEIVRAPISFTGTSGVVRFDGGATPAMHALLGHGLEHHVAIAYGEHRDALHAVARALGLPVIDLTKDDRR